MPIDKTLIRNFDAELNTGDEMSPNWVHVGGIDNMSHSPTTNRADTRVWDDGGRLTHLVASRGDSFTFTGKYLVDSDTGDRDPGQEAVEAWAAGFDVDGLKQFRVTDSSGINVITFYASAELTRPSGGNDDPASWGFSVEVSGDIT